MSNSEARRQLVYSIRAELARAGMSPDTLAPVIGADTAELCRDLDPHRDFDEPSALTLETVAQIADALHVHPLTLLARFSMASANTDVATSPEEVGRPGGFSGVRSELCPTCRGIGTHLTDCPDFLQEQATLSAMEEQFLTTPTTAPPCPAWCGLPAGHPWEATDLGDTVDRWHFADSPTTGWYVGVEESWDPVTGVGYGEVVIGAGGKEVTPDEARRIHAEIGAVIATYEAARSVQ